MATATPVPTKMMTPPTGPSSRRKPQVLYDKPLILKLKAAHIAGGAHGSVNQITVNEEL